MGKKSRALKPEAWRIFFKKYQRVCGWSNVFTGQKKAFDKWMLCSYK
jgi:hypothetical protein